jgi:hypothetical protein
MSADVLRALLAIQPFRGFRLVLLETTSYEVRHPEQLVVGRRIAKLSVPQAEDPVRKMEIYINLRHISRVEPLLRN